MVYTYVFVLQEAITFSAQQGAQAAVAVVQQSNSGATTAARKVQADNAALSALSWLPGSQYSRVSTSAPTTTTACLNGNTPPSPPANSFIYQVSFNLGGNAGSGGTVQPLFPTLGTLPLVGNISLLPGTLTACAIAFT